MKEYRIRAYFKEVYPDRSYKGKVFLTYAGAEKALPEAIEYYNSRQYKDRLLKVQIESRNVDSWKEERSDHRGKTLKELATEYAEKGIETVIEIEWWWSSYESWRPYFNYPDLENPEEYGNKMELDSEYSFKGSAEEFLKFCEQYESIGDLEGKDCQEFKIDEYLDSKGFKGGVVIFAKYIEEAI